MEYKFGFKASLPDIRDYKLQTKQIGPLPDAVDLRAEFPGIWDQGPISSCTANASTALIRHILKKENIANDEHLSRLFLYYVTREIDESTKSDNGATLRDTFKAINKFGVCAENLWPYTPSKVKAKPSNKSYNDGLKRTSKNYFAIPQTEEGLKNCLAEGYGFVFGFAVYESFMSDQVKNLGIVQIPKISERIQGGHAVLCNGYKDNYFIIRNSWGDKWGDHGHCYMPKEFILHPSICMDFWSLR